MNTKLTLTMEKEVIETAKEYARCNGQSLSEMVENYFKMLTATGSRKLSQKKLSPNVKKLRGIINIENGKDYKEILAEELTKKYGL